MNLPVCWGLKEQTLEFHHSGTSNFIYIFEINISRLFWIGHFREVEKKIDRNKNG